MATLRNTVLALAAAVMLLPAAALAWGRLGHATVWEIARRNMTPEALAEADKLVQGASPDLVGSWADNVRSFAKETGPWHYLNLPDTGFDPQPEQLYLEEGNIWQALVMFRHQLGQGREVSPQRRTALLFFIHFVGDVHQPMHLGRKSDLGGNLVMVQMDGAEKKLHATWDEDIPVKLYGRISGKESWTSDPAAFAEAILARAKDEAKHQAMNATDPMVWLGESYGWARRAYDVPSGPDGRPTLTESYQEEGMRIVEGRLLRAGLRLAAVLNEELTRKEPAPAPADLGKFSKSFEQTRAAAYLPK